MDHTPKKVFILENNEYIEITFQELYQRRQNDSSFRERKFLFEDGFLMEVREHEYVSFRKEKRRQRYHKEQAAKNNDVSLDNLPEEELASLSVTSEQDISDIVEQRIMHKNLAEALSMLPEDDQLLIYRYYFSNIPENRLAELYDVTQQTISWRIKRIQEQLKKILG